MIFNERLVRGSECERRIREDEEARWTKVCANAKGALPHHMLSPSDTAIVFLLALLLFGPDQLPRIARQLGEAMRHVQTTTHTFMNEMERAARANESPPPLPPIETASSGSEDVEDGPDDATHSPPASTPG
jgi:TatA/E family protein of Tat protein translocase